MDLYNIALDCVDKNARSLRNRHKIALISAGRTVKRLTFSNLEGLTNRFANILKGLGIFPGSRLILRAPNSPEFPVVFLGAVKAGVIPIPTSPLLTWHELKFLLTDSEASVLFTTQELLPPELFQHKPSGLSYVLVKSPKGEELPTGTLRFDELLYKASPHFETRPTEADLPAYWLYTSGTEGMPKAVIHAHRSIRAHDARSRIWQDFKEEDIIFNTSALNWSYALTCGLLDGWRHGLTSLVYDGPPEPETLCKIVRDFQVTTFMSVPGIYRRLARYLKEEGGGFGSVRVALSAGEALDEEVRRTFHDSTGLEIYGGLGMTEHSVYLVQPYGKPVVPGAGLPLPGHRIAVLKEDLTEASPGEVGVLASHRSCPGLMLGYHNRPQEEKRVFRGEWFLSDDLARRDEDGNFFFLGRRDDVMTVGGYRISPMEIESALNRSPDVAESAAVGTQFIRAFVVLKKGIQPKDELRKKILAFAATQLASYKLPREIVFLKELPKTANGKIKRRELKN
jgi:acyl-coenzyme A synthetase/AMP-(fatty) acid ligase